MVLKNPVEKIQEKYLLLVCTLFFGWNSPQDCEGNKCDIQLFFTPHILELCGEKIGFMYSVNHILPKAQSSRRDW